ncbi:group I intron-associated PD-(D/E)XK endonuclease [Halovivax gelatinilyticus]|uniref:group I intron-associated PD-(D/E)XK endonuclease n=1 Tax=Halovivax gelatinilyticus TaxID=2961597 RepID=UPI0020CA8546|nr:group I intron-associated PD-(D/E)XK endonuclease [Halovivax gelatinilyticus]
MNSKQVGDVTEVRILARLIATGYSVAIPYGDNDPYDLLVDTGSSILKVQCKTGWVEGEVIRFKTASKTTCDGQVTMVDYGDKIDAFAVYCESENKYYWVPIDDAGAKSTYLRLAEPAIDHPSVNRASEYTFSSQLPSIGPE